MSPRRFAQLLTLLAVVGTALGALLAFRDSTGTFTGACMGAGAVFGAFAMFLGVKNRQKPDRMLAPVGVMLLVGPLNYFLGTRLPDTLRLGLLSVVYVVAVFWFIRVRRSLRRMREARLSA